MCGRFTQERATSELAEIFSAADLADDAGGRYNVAPTDDGVVVVQRDDRRAIVRYRWGLVPHWSSDARSAARMINARAETVARSTAFAEAFRRRRCIVPADSFYEWRREGSARLPFRVVRIDAAPLPLAGLWAGWRDPECGEVRRTFTIVTSAPNRTVASLHDRMPVILRPEDWGRWLDPAANDPGELLAMLEPRDDEPLEIHAVPPLVNNVRNDGPALIERVSPPAVPIPGGW